MGGAVSVENPSELRREYEALAAKNIGDQELLNHMKKLIISPAAANESVEKEKAPASKANGGRRSSVRRGSASGSNVQGAPAGSSGRRGSAVSGEGTAGSTARRGSASRPSSHSGRVSYSSSTMATQQRTGSNANARRQSVDVDRPLSAPPTKPAVPTQRPRSSSGDKNGASGKPAKSRRRSYLGQPTTGGRCGEAVASAAEVAVSAAAAEGAAVAQDDPAQDPDNMQIDSWESVSQQPSCPLCHMVFSTEGKRDQHIKYSPVHAPPAEGSEPQPAPEPVMDSITIYSGTKLFWRTRLDVELFMQQHKTVNAVQVLVFDVSTNHEIAQVWMSWNNVVAKLDAKEMKKEMEAAERAFYNLGLTPTPENVEAEATRKAAVSFIIKRIQVDDIVDEGSAPGSSKSYKVSMMQMAADDDDTTILVDQPEGVNPTFSRALMKRASMQEVNEVMTILRKSLGDVSKDAQAAVASLGSVEGVVEQGRRGSVEVARRASIQGS